MGVKVLTHECFKLKVDGLMKSFTAVASCVLTSRFTTHYISFYVIKV